MNCPEDLDVIVIGGGPIGGIVAENTARNHLSTMIFEEHKSIGRPEHCTGLISVNGFHSLQIFPPKPLVLNEVKGASIFSPGGEKLTVERDCTQAYVMDRVSLDQYLIEKAIKSGSQLQLNAKVKDITIEKTGAFVTAETGTGMIDRKKITFGSKLVIFGEGAQAKLTKRVGLSVPNPRMKLYATQFHMSNIDLERNDLVEIYLGSFAAGFFAWVVPTSNDSARVGLATTVPKSNTLLRHFVSHHPVAGPKLAKAKIRNIFGGNVLTGGPIEVACGDRFLAVGDCAGQTKPTTGGGVITGGICAKIAGRVAVDSIAKADFSKKFLRAYDTRWQGQLGKEFSSMLLLRRVLNHLPDSLLNKMLITAKKIGLERIMEEKGDIDVQSQLIGSVTKNPRIIIAFLLSFIGIP